MGHRPGQTRSLAGLAMPPIPANSVECFTTAILPACPFSGPLEIIAQPLIIIISINN